jgi:hypothetical protein
VIVQRRVQAWSGGEEVGQRGQDQPAEIVLAASVCHLVGDHRLHLVAGAA